MVSITTVATLHIRTAKFCRADFEQRFLLDRATN